jgi:RNA polymerase sigma-70 factor (ECF subfamily)
MDHPAIDPATWVNRYGDLLFRYLMARMNDRVAVEDIVQDTFLSALKGLKGFKGESSEKSWLFAIARNKMIDHFRKSSRELIEFSDHAYAGDADWFDKDGQWVQERIPLDWKSGPDEIERKEIQAIILRCKEHLKKVQDQVFTLKYMEGMTADAICKVLGITSSNYWVLIHRARLQMRECVEKSFH